MPLQMFAEDWYRLRKGGEAAIGYIPAERLAFYRQLCARLPVTQGTGMPARFVALLRILGAYLDRLPNADFVVHLPGLDVSRA